MGNLSVVAADGSPACVGTYIQGTSRTWAGFGETIFAYWEREDTSYWLQPDMVDGFGVWWKITNGTDDWYIDSAGTETDCNGLYTGEDITQAQVGPYVPEPDPETPPNKIFITLAEGSDPAIPDCTGTYNLINITTTYTLFGATEFPLWRREDDEFWLEPIAGGEEFNTQWAVVNAPDWAGAMWSSGNLTMNMPLGTYSYTQGDPGDPYNYSEIVVSDQMPPKSVTDTLTVTDALLLTFYSFATGETLLFHETVENNIKFGDAQADPDILLDDEAIGWNAYKGGTQIVPLVDEASAQYLPSRTQTDSITLTHLLTYILDTYVCPVPVPKVDYTTLFYPYVDPVMSLTLPNPEFGDTDTLEARRVNRRSRGNTLQIFRDEHWPLARRLNMTFLGLTETQKKDLLVFLEESIGDEIGLLDYEGTQRKVIVTTPAANAQQPGVTSNSITLQFEVTG